jgi:hypothetical protein
MAPALPTIRLHQWVAPEARRPGEANASPSSNLSAQTTPGPHGLGVWHPCMAGTTAWLSENGLPMRPFLSGPESAG